VQATHLGGVVKKKFFDAQKKNLKTHFQVLKFSFFAGKSSEVLRTFMLVVAQNVCLVVLSSFVESFGLCLVR